MTTIETPAIGQPEIEQAAERLGDALRVTPVIDPRHDFFGRAASISCKLELLQHTGSFKPRGALNRALVEQIPEPGLIAASGGNHGLAVAWAARRLNVAAEIFVPEVSPATKVDALRELGATVHVTGALYADALLACRQRQTETGALDIHAYDHLDTIAGAGTIAREMHQQLGEIDTVLVALGGGGLAAGVAAWFATLNTKVITVEPERSRCFAAAHAAGEPVDVEVGGRAADSLGAPRIGLTNWQVLKAAGVEPVTVSDDAILYAQRRFWNDLKLVVEPGGAAAAAAIWGGAVTLSADERVAVIVCGANTDAASVR